VRQPLRIEIIVKETAKFEKPLIFRSSSWAYPSSCRRSVSVFTGGRSVVTGDIGFSLRVCIGASFPLRAAHILCSPSPKVKGRGALNKNLRPNEQATPAL